MDSTGLHWTPLDSSPLRWEIVVIKFQMDSTWTVQSSGLHSTPLHSSQTSLGGLGCGESPLESTGVQWSPVESIWNMGGTDKTSNRATRIEVSDARMLKQQVSGRMKDNKSSVAHEQNLQTQTLLEQHSRNHT